MKIEISNLKELLGKRVLVGITRVDHKEKILSQEQFHGCVESLRGGLVHIRVAGSGHAFTLPPEPSAFVRARPGHYRLRLTGEVVIDPDFTTSWTVKAPTSKTKSKRKHVAQKRTAQPSAPANRPPALIPLHQGYGGQARGQAIAELVRPQYHEWSNCTNRRFDLLRKRIPPKRRRSSVLSIKLNLSVL